MKQTVATWTCEQCAKTRVVYDPPIPDTADDYLERMDARIKAQVEESRWLTVTGGAGSWEAHYCSENCLRYKLHSPVKVERCCTGCGKLVELQMSPEAIAKGEHLHDTFCSSDCLRDYNSAH